LQRAAIGVAALVGAVAQELVDQVTVRRMDLDTVDPASKACQAALPYCSTMPGISAKASARGTTNGWKPWSV
jgi:hypothetical protein